MTRRVYETPASKAAERAVLRRLAEVSDLNVYELPPFNRLDAGLCSGNKLRVLAEVKCRTDVRSDQYPTSFVNMSKVLAAHEYARVLRIPSILIVKYSDGVRWCRLDSDPDGVTVQGRKDRGDPDDIQLMAHFALDRMQSGQELIWQLRAGPLRRLCEDMDGSIYP